MASIDRPDCRKLFFVNGEMLLRAMSDRGLTEKQVVIRAGVAEQTVRNYIGSTIESAWPADSSKFQAVCEVLRLDHKKAQLSRLEPTTPNAGIGACVDLRFLGNPQTVRRIDGKWKAKSIDVEIEGFLTYTAPIPWSAALTIEQFGNRFECRGTDKDDDYAEEATKVRRIFSLYLELKNLLPVVEELDKRGWNNKLWQSKKGLPKGGRQFDKCSVHAMLTNPIYCGKIKHKTDLYQGQHQAIVDEEIFERVQAQLRENGFNRGNRMPSKHGGLLKGLIRCPNCNVAMVHNMTKRNSIVYRYYTCVRAIKRGRQSCKHPSLPAGEIEAAVVDQVRDISRDAGHRDEIIRQAMVAAQQGRKEIEAHQIQLGRQLARDHGEIRQLALDERPGGQVSHRIADIQERIEKAELELAKVNRQLVDLEKHEMSTQEIEDALIDFDRIWDALTTREQSQLLSLLVSKVEFDQSDCTIAITFHASGIETLDQQSQEV